MNFIRRLFGWPQRAHFGSFRMGYLMGFEAGAQAGMEHVVNQIKAQGFDIQVFDDSKPTPDARLN